MISKIFACALVLCSFSLNVHSQSVIQNLESSKVPTDTLSSFLKDYLVQKIVSNDDGTFTLDTVSLLYVKDIGQLEYLQASNEPRYVPTDPNLYRLFVPFTYYESAIEQYSNVSLKEDETYKSSAVTPDTYGLTYNKNAFNSIERTNTQVNKALLQAYVNEPQKVINTESGIMGVRSFDDQIEKEAKKKKAVTKMVEQPEAISKAETDRGLDFRKPNWWDLGGSYSIQMTQNYISANWYKGGESNYSLLGTLQFYAKYNDKEKIQWESYFDAKLGLSSTHNDEYHKFLFNTDQLRLTSKLGVQAMKNWYYTLSVEAKTQFCNGYSSNNPERISAFLSPLDVSASVGMDYKLKKKNFQLSVFLAPLTYSMRYVGNENVSVTRYGLEEGKNIKHDFGSQIKPVMNWQIAKNIKWDSSLNFITSYHWTRVEWENTFNFILNKYLSTKLYLNSRFDDSAAPRIGTSYFQLNEILSFGINYSF